MWNIHDVTYTLDGCFTLIIAVFQKIFEFLNHTFYQYHSFRLSIFDFALSLMVLDAVCLLVFPWYSSDDENE